MKQGLTPAEIARRVGRSEGRVGQISALYRLNKAAPVGCRPLSQRQVCMLAFLQDFTARHSYPPTIREIVEGCGLSGASVGSGAGASAGAVVGLSACAGASTGISAGAVVGAGMDAAAGARA